MKYQCWGGFCYTVLASGRRKKILVSYISVAITITIVVQGSHGKVNILCIMKILFTIDLDVIVSTNTRNKYVHGLEIIKSTHNKWIVNNLVWRWLASQLLNGGLAGFLFVSLSWDAFQSTFSQWDEWIDQCCDRGTNIWKGLGMVKFVGQIGGMQDVNINVVLIGMAEWGVICGWLVLIASVFRLGSIAFSFTDTLYLLCFCVGLHSPSGWWGELVSTFFCCVGDSCHSTCQGGQSSFVGDSFSGWWGESVICTGYWWWLHLRIVGELVSAVVGTVGGSTSG